MSTVVLYHGDCVDGFTAAWAVRRAIPDAILVPAFFTTPPPDVTGEHVVLVDFSYDEMSMAVIMRQASKVTWLDHHVTALPTVAKIEEALAKYPGEMAPLDWTYGGREMSGAGLAWTHFHGAPVPKLVEYVQDNDLYKRELPFTDEAFSYIASFEYRLGAWDALHKAFEDPAEFVEATIQGAAILRKQKRDMEGILKSNTRTMWIGGFLLSVANAPYSLVTMAGNELAERSLKKGGHPAAATYSDQRNSRKFSLRSLTDDFDVSKIAQQYGGGGHVRASGFHVPLAELASKGLL